MGYEELQHKGEKMLKRKKKSKLLMEIISQLSWVINNLCQNHEALKIFLHCRIDCSRSRQAAKSERLLRAEGAQAFKVGIIFQV